jgi:hypothetical protein
MNGKFPLGTEFRNSEIAFLSIDPKKGSNDDGIKKFSSQAFERAELLPKKIILN